jgi:prepilin-type N-terminal cleavage/methylation domain-containing protein
VGKSYAVDGGGLNVIRARGFALVELVVVIVILGIVAAVAIPRFIDLSREARIAKLEAGRGAVGSGAALANSVSVTHGLGPTVSVPMAGAMVTMAFSSRPPIRLASSRQRGSARRTTHLHLGSHSIPRTAWLSQ